MCAWGICRDGRKVLLHLTLGNKESACAWREFVRDMQRRGLSVPTLVCSDGAPALIAVIEDLRCPPLHFKHIRTPNLIERAFAKQRRRLKTLPRFWDEKRGLKLVFATLAQANERWQNVRMSEIEIAILKQLRRALGLEPPAAPGGLTFSVRRAERITPSCFYGNFGT